MFVTNSMSVGQTALLGPKGGEGCLENAFITKYIKQDKGSVLNMR